MNSNLSLYASILQREQQAVEELRAIIDQHAQGLISTEELWIKLFDLAAQQIENRS